MIECRYPSQYSSLFAKRPIRECQIDCLATATATATVYVFDDSASLHAAAVVIELYSDLLRYQLSL
jgi:hypothetical protein